MTRHGLAAAMVVLAACGLASAQAPRMKAPPRLAVAVEPPAAAVAPGERFALSVRIVPNPGIHVYAPGNPDNIPVSVSVTPAPGLAADPAKFPKAEDFFFGPLAETLKVYTKPFVVTVPMRVDADVARAHDIALSGAVRYQACDDRVCFPPQSAPFETRVLLRADRR